MRLSKKKVASVAASVNYGLQITRGNAREDQGRSSLSHPKQIRLSIFLERVVASAYRSERERLFSREEIRENEMREIEEKLIGSEYSILLGQKVTTEHENTKTLYTS